jgi:two-component sensor histidine kinase
MALERETNSLPASAGTLLQDDAVKADAAALEAKRERHEILQVVLHRRRAIAVGKSGFRGAECLSLFQSKALPVCGQAAFLVRQPALSAARRWLMLRKTSNGDPGVAAHDDLATAIAAIPANARQRKIALRVLIVLVIVAVVNAPFALIHLGAAHSFLPVIEGVMSTVNLLTAIFLFVQYWLYPQRALLALAGGFVFSGLFALLHTFAFPAAHHSTVLFGDTFNSPTWLFIFWQTTFALAIIVYALSKDASEPVSRSSRSIFEVGVTIACVLMVTAALAWVAIAGFGYLPPLHQGEIPRTPFSRDVITFVTLLNAIAFAVLYVRRYTLLDHWLMVTLAAWWPTLVMAVFFTGSIRFLEGWYLARVFALFTGSSLLVVLLTETLLLHRRYGQHQRQLIAELDHRVKNILAQVAAVVSATRQSSRSIGEFIGSLDGRIQSMAAAHTLLSNSGWNRVRLDAVVRNQLAPYMTGGNITIGGPDAMLASAEIQALSRVLHELATNAAKYGALSIPGGQVSLTWDLKLNGAPTNLTLVWREFGGPPVAPKVQSSFGTDLIRHLIPHELGGMVELAFAAEGVNCRIEIPSSSR